MNFKKLKKSKTLLNTKIPNESRLLDLHEKLDVSADLLKMLESEKQEKLNASKQLIETLQTLIHAADRHIDYVTKSAIDFKKEVISGNTDLFKWFESKDNQRSNQINRMLQKTESLRKNKVKLQALLKENEESRKQLQYINFHQLQIESETDSFDLEKYDKKVLQHREENTKMQRILNKTLDILKTIQSEYDDILQKKSSRKPNMKKISIESEKIKRQVEHESKILRKKINSSSQESNEKCLEIDDYIDMKAKFYELKSSIKTWERKVRIAETVAN